MPKDRIVKSGFKTKKKLLIWSGILVILTSCVKVYIDTNVMKVNKVQFHNEKIPADSEFTILQISDLHNKEFGQNNEKLIQTVKKENADIIVLTGDLISRDTNNFSNVFMLVEKITALNKHVYFVTGNHEWDHTNTRNFVEGLQERNVTVLNNQSSSIKIGQVIINLVGIDDVSTNHENMSAAFVNVDKTNYTVLLSHAPNVVEEYEDISADLILSGHTHGGQIRVPFIGAIVAPDQGLLPQLEKGTYEINENQFLYIDSGLGTSVAPVRFLNQSQVSVITISGAR
ncbi:metallophosphoesterase [Ornithinibacillus xuwenensis]|uniref:Metallophosphoesterase n=1 Tax=Ornithinibacillus xuwenensis TaxID=3144668 RepID=A0ABU9XI24_9BACI